jgi:hypothetical protein
MPRDRDPHSQITVLRRKQRVAHRHREAAGEPVPETASKDAHEDDFNAAVTAPPRREGSANPLSTLNA